MWTLCSLQCLMRLTQIIGPVCSMQSDIKAAHQRLCTQNEAEPQHRWYVIGHGPTALRTARQKREAETRGQMNVNEGGASMRRVGHWRDSRLLILGRLVFVV